MSFLFGTLFGFFIAVGVVWFLFFLLGRNDKVESMAVPRPMAARTLRYTLGLITLTF